MSQARAFPIQQIKSFCTHFCEKWNKLACQDTFKRILKRYGFSWKRMRQSLKSERDEILFQFFKKELQLLHEQAERDEIDLYFFDETGLQLNPNIPYAWQEVGETTLLPARKGGATILGLFSKQKQEVQGAILPGAATGEWVVKVLDQFSEQLDRKTILILDNATIHTAKCVQERRKHWAELGLHLQFIPAYSPELNLIELVWKQLKHFWLRPEHYKDQETLESAARKILAAYGEEYTISFA